MCYMYHSGEPCRSVGVSVLGLERAVICRVAVHANRLAAAALLAAVLLVVGPSHAALTFNIVGVSGVESTFAGTATTYQSVSTLQADSASRRT